MLLFVYHLVDAPIPQLVHLLKTELRLELCNLVFVELPLVKHEVVRLLERILLIQAWLEVRVQRHKLVLVFESLKHFHLVFHLPRFHLAELDVFLAVLLLRLPQLFLSFGNKLFVVREKIVNQLFDLYKIIIISVDIAIEVGELLVHDLGDLLSFRSLFSK